MQCQCCGAEITAPQFYNGKAYGWSCILKVAPKYNRSKVHTYVQAEAIEDLSPLARRALINGKWYRETRSTEQMPYRQISDNGIIQVTAWTDTRTGRALVAYWRGLEHLMRKSA